jgi:hypothetical protein
MAKNKFTIENDWTPSKLYELDDYMKDLLKAVKTLKPGQSIPLSVMDLKKRYGWKNATGCCNSIRYAFGKFLTDSFRAKLTFHEVKQDGNKSEFIRIRHKKG